MFLLFAMGRSKNGLNDYIDSHLEVLLLAILEIAIETLIALFFFIVAVNSIL